jgi:hypothetical protein
MRYFIAALMPIRTILAIIGLFGAIGLSLPLLVGIIIFSPKGIVEYFEMFGDFIKYLYRWVVQI